MSSPSLTPTDRSPLEVTLFFTAFVAITYGFGIYLFAALVPDMRTSLGFDYATVGIATGIAQAGFLVASLASGLLAPIIGATRLIFGSVAVTGFSLLLMSRLGGTGEMTLLLTVMGATAASVWVPMVAVCQQVIPARHHGKALGLMSSGTSYGVFINGLIVPPLLATAGWSSAWLATGLLALLLLIAAWGRLRGLGQARQVAADKTTSPAVTLPLRQRLRLVLRPLGLLLIATMFLNGLSCMPFQTYLVPLLREDFGWNAGAASHLWSLIGGIGMIGGFALGWLADRISIKWAMAVTYLLLGIAAAIPLALSHLGLAAISTNWMNLAGISFSLAFYAIFGLVPAYISAWYKGDAATLLFGIGNIALGLGGLIGNLGGGYAKDWFGSFAPVYGMVLAAALLQLLLALVTPNERRQKAIAGQIPAISPSCG